MTAVRSTFVPGFTVLAAVLIAGGCGKTPVGPPSTGPAGTPDLLARPAGFQIWDYERPAGPRPGSLFGAGGTVTGRVKVIERWPTYFDLHMVPRSEYDRVRVGMTYDEVRAIIGDVLLPFRFDPESEYDLCCVQDARIALFRFRGGTLVGKDQQGIE
jgi:hypothetical protein